MTNSITTKWLKPALAAAILAVATPDTGMAAFNCDLSSVQHVEHGADRDAIPVRA